PRPTTGRSSSDGTAPSRVFPPARKPSSSKSCSEGDGVDVSLARRALPLLAGALTSPGVRDLRRRATELRRRMSGQPHRVLYFHQVDDPYSHLAAQVLPRLRERFDVELEPHV